MCFYVYSVYACGWHTTFWNETVESIAMAASSLISEDLTCAVCLDLYTKPRVLRCMHTYCHDCMASLVQKNRQTSFIFLPWMSTEHKSRQQRCGRTSCQPSIVESCWDIQVYTTLNSDYFEISNLYGLQCNAKKTQKPILLINYTIEFFKHIIFSTAT